MTPAKTTYSARAAKTAAAREAAQRAERRRRTTKWGVGLLLSAALAAGLYGVFNRSNSGSQHAKYQIGRPGVGAAAPGFDLAASTGKQTSLANYKGKTVLLYFQEGLTCQPCWDQMTDLEKAAGQLKAAGIDQVLSITTDPADLIARKAGDMHLSTPVLSDPDLAVSKAYTANSYGMMGTSRDGHSFVLVGPNGAIRWRADYGGAPDYTMYVPVDRLLADLRAGEVK